MGLNGNVLSHTTFPKWFPNNHQATNSGWCMQKSARFCPPHKSLIHKACLLSLHGVSQLQSIFAQQFETRSLHRVEHGCFKGWGKMVYTFYPIHDLAEIQQRGHGQQPATMVQDMGFQRTTPEAPTGWSRHVWSSGQTRIGFSTGFRMQ